MRTVRWVNEDVLQVIDDPWPPGGEGMMARLYYKGDYQSWSRLPADIELPPAPYVERTRPASRGEITRGSTALGSATKQGAPSRKRLVERSYRDVELRDRGFVDYRVSIGSTAREAIIDEIQRAHRDAGQPIEVAGWLLGQYQPRAEGKWTQVALATRSTERSGSRDTVYLSDPAAAVTAVRGAGYPRMELLGDWHSHVVPGSELPSVADARAWAGTMDSLGRDAYVSVIVSPSPELGWTFPRFSAWVAGRYGTPSTPIVGRASLD